MAVALMPLPEDAAVPPDKVSPCAPASLADLHSVMATGCRSSTPGLPRPGGELGNLLRLAEGLGNNPTCLRADLAALVGDRERLVDVATRSSIHPNGFAKIVLYPGDQFSIRLHVWSRQEGLWAKETQPHGHRWAFASWIITGAVREVAFSAEWRPGSSVRYDRYGYAREGSRPRLDPLGNAVLFQDKAVDHVAGDVYGRARDELHTAVPVGDGLAASLVLQGSHHDAPALVYVPFERRPLEGEQSLDAVRVQSLVESVLEPPIPTQRNDRLLA